MLLLLCIRGMGLGMGLGRIGMGNGRRKGRRRWLGVKCVARFGAYLCMHERIMYMSMWNTLLILSINT